jgi:hypothetical protein
MLLLRLSSSGREAASSLHPYPPGDRLATAGGGAALKARAVVGLADGITCPTRSSVGMSRAGHGEPN